MRSAVVNELHGVNPVQLAKDELPIPVKVEFDEYYLPARALHGRRV